MFLDDKFCKYQKPDCRVNLFSSTLKQNVIKQAASMLLQHVTLHKKFYRITNNNNGNAFDEYYLSANSIQRNEKEFKRTDKCNSWLSRFPTKSDTSLNRLSTIIGPAIQKFQALHHSPPRSYYPQIERSHSPINRSSHFHQNSITFSTNAAPNTNNEVNPQFESFSQPLIVVHKKRLRRDYFLSTMQNCIQPPYSQNHFYLFDQTNMQKFQRNLHSTSHRQKSKRKYREVDDEPDCICSEAELDRQSPTKNHITSPVEQSSPKTADHISINKYHSELESPFTSNEKSAQIPQSDQSQIILSRLEKILDVCGELRTLAKDVESHFSEQPTTKTNDENSIKKSESEQTIIDIYKELDFQQTTTDINEQNAPPPYQHTNDTLSIHSDNPIMETKSSTLITSNPTIRKAEDICSCFLKSFFDKNECDLNPHEQAYLNELTKAYLLGKEQSLINTPISSKEKEAAAAAQEHESIHSSSLLFYNSFPKSENYLSSTSSCKLNNSTISLTKPDQQQSSKYQTFFNQPIGMKTTNVLPGIGNKYAEQLSQCGFSTVRRLLAFYLMIKDDQHFVIWLNNKVGVATHSAWLCTNALRTWCQLHL